MLKCINSISSEFIIILHPQWKMHLADLRELDVQNRLLCPLCHQPVRVRAGKIKRWHFAHKHLQNCLLQNESTLLLQTRAILYEWLVEHYGTDKVTVEKLIPELPFPRYIDCWVDHEPTPILYWIFDTRRPPIERLNLKEAFKGSNTHVHTLFTASMMNPDEFESQHVYLTTTERAFLESSSFDALIRGYAFSAGKTLHYLSETDKTLITYRNLHLVHPPQEYAGYRVATLLPEVFPIPETGELSHPGELEKLDKLQSKTQKLQEKQQRILPQILKGSTASMGQKGTTTAPHLPGPLTPPLKAEYNPFSKTAICRKCGNLTSDWITFDGKNGTCLCRNCYNKDNP